jgi:Fic/DOC family
MPSFESDLLDAWEWWTSLNPPPLIPTLDLVREFHLRLFKSNSPMRPGQIKQYPNFIPISGMQFLHLCPPEEVKTSYTNLCDEMSQLQRSFTDFQAHPTTTVGMIERATFIAHYHARFIQIHPFNDGNGRLSRLIGYAQRILLFPEFDFLPPGAASPRDSHLYFGVDADSYRSFMQKAHENLFYLIRYWMPGSADSKPRVPFPSSPPFPIPHIVRHYRPS